MTFDLIERDKRERQLALDASQSFIVQAPAGSGKTELLIQRFLTLLQHVKTPEEILAITFTKKAANEMRLRVINALKNAQTEPEPETNHAKQTWCLAKLVLQRDQQLDWHLLNNPNQLRIQTIDSLCAFLTRQLPLLSHFGSQPEIADQPALLYREAVQEVLMHVEEKFEWSQAISKLLLHLDNDLNKLHDLLVNLLERRDQWLPYIQFDINGNDVRKKLEHYLELIISEQLTTITHLLPKEIISELIAIARFAAGNLTSPNTDLEINACRDLAALPLPLATHKHIWCGLARLLLTKENAWRKRVHADIGFPALSSLKNPQEKALHTAYRERFNQLITTLNDHENLRIALAEIFFLPESHYEDTQWEILQALLHLLKIVAAQLRLTFQQHGQIDFIENAQAALFALGNDEYPTDLALALDYQIKHILVDEFQDTSFTQYQLLEKLTLGWEVGDGRTLFVVGDPMQSIYRFREAEVGLFIRMRKNGIGHIPLIPLTLTVNFRSASPIVEWNNLHFQSIFPTWSDIATGAVHYSKSISYQTAQEKNSFSQVDIRSFIDADGRIQAMHIVKLIEQINQDHPTDKIAILVRSRTHLATIMPALKKAKIRYHAVDIDPLASRQVIQDLLSLTSALIHPADRIAWLAILRAPWCGLTLADLLIIAGDHPHSTIWEQLEQADVLMKLSPDGQKRLARVMPLLSAKMAERERYDLRYWIESTWILLGGPACLSDDIDNNDAHAFFELLDDFSQKNHLLNLDKLKEKVNQLYASTQHEQANLHIMTIHTAKGLEFDTVIVPHLERKMPSDDKALLSWMERPLTNDQNVLLLAPIHATGNEKDSLYEYINRMQRAKSMYEIDRLFYVATTRAKKRLYLFFNLNQKNDATSKIESSAFLGKLWPFLKKESVQSIASDLIETNIENKKNKFIFRLDTEWKNPIEKINTKKIITHQKQNGFQLVDHQPKLVGIIAHKILQHITQLSIAWWQSKNHEQHINYIHHQLKQHYINADEDEQSVHLINSLIKNTLNDARGQWIIQSHQEAKSEFYITAVIDGQIENLIIDRTFIDETGTRWIIDYKTTAFSYHDLEMFLDREQEKYLIKMHHYAKAMQVTNPTPLRLGLYFPALPAWREWQIK